MDLIHSLDLKPREIISLVGGGGKTTLMFALAREISGAGYKVITTTTTKIFEPSPMETPKTLFLNDFSFLPQIKYRACSDLFCVLKQELDKFKHITLAQERIPGRKLKGISPDIIHELDRLQIAPFIVVEADGSRSHPLKAPNTTEPVIPENTSLVIAVVGIEALNCPLTEDYVFRAKLAAQLLGLTVGSPVTAEAIAILMTHADGIAKGSPARARIIPFINKTDLNGGLQNARDLAAQILNRRHPQINKVVLGEANSAQNPVCEIVQ